MNANEKVRKEIFLSKIFILVGLMAAVVGGVFNYQRDMMLGLTTGFFPTGIGLFLVYKYSLKNPSMLKNIELENEERNIFINREAGRSAFWISFLYMFIAVMLGNMVNIPFKAFGIFTLFFMPAIYFLFVFLFHKKY